MFVTFLSLLPSIHQQSRNLQLELISYESHPCFFVILHTSGKIHSNTFSKELLKCGTNSLMSVFQHYMILSPSSLRAVRIVSVLRHLNHSLSIHIFILLDSLIFNSLINSYSFTISHHHIIIIHFVKVCQLRKS